jgi:hypothetical protein
MVPPLDSGLVFIACVMAGIAYMALPVARLVSVEMVERLLAVAGHRPMVAMPWIEAVVHVAVKAVRPMKPRTRTEEQPANEPIRTIVAIRGTIIRRIVEVPVRAHRRRSNADYNLGWCYRNRAEQRNRHSGNSEKLKVAHRLSLLLGFRTQVRAASCVRLNSILKKPSA